MQLSIVLSMARARDAALPGGVMVPFWVPDPMPLQELADTAGRVGPVILVAVGPVLPGSACGAGLPDVRAAAAAARTATSTITAAMAPAAIATDVPGPGSWGMARRSRRGKRLDWLALRTSDCSQLTRASAAADPVAAPAIAGNRLAVGVAAVPDPPALDRVTTASRVASVPEPAIPLAAVPGPLLPG